MSITINHLRGVSSSKISKDPCAICGENICESCINCRGSKDTCVFVVGECGDIYHYCCITNHINKQSYNGKKCPLCTNPWVMKRRTDNDQEYKNKNKNKYINSTSNLINNIILSDSETNGEINNVDAIEELN